MESKTDNTTLDSNTVSAALDRLATTDDVIAAMLIAIDDGRVIATRAGSECQMNLTMAASAYAQIIRAQNKVSQALAQHNHLEDIQITQSKQYHLLMRLPVDDNLFLLVILARQTHGSLGMVRLAMSQVGKQITYVSR